MEEGKREIEFSAEKSLSGGEKARRGWFHLPLKKKLVRKRMNECLE